MIGERLSDLRKDRGLTQKELADALHLTKDNISAYEREYNEAPDNVKIAIAQFFDVSVDYLLGLTDSPNSYAKPLNCIYLAKDFPDDAKVMLQTLARLISIASRKSPKAVAKELDRLEQLVLEHGAEQNSEPPEAHAPSKSEQ